jgi:hypothetical protein
MKHLKNWGVNESHDSDSRIDWLEHQIYAEGILDPRLERRMKVELAQEIAAWEREKGRKWVSPHTAPIGEDVNIESDVPVVGEIYRVIDKKTGSKLNTAARFEGDGEFTILSSPSQKKIPLDLSTVILTKTTFVPDVKAMKSAMRK